MNLSSYFAFIAWFALLVLFSFILDYLWCRIFPRRGYRLFITLGIITHELSHAVACVLMRARISRIRFFAPEGGAVEHGPPKVPIIGKPLIGLAPLFGCSLTLLGLFFLFKYQQDLPSIDFGASFFSNLTELFQSAADFFSSYASQWTFWFFLYLAVSIAASIAPSAADFKNAFWGILFLAVLGWAMIYFKIGDQFVDKIINQYLGRIITLGALMESIALIITVPIYFIKKLVARNALF